jgi:MoaA/NifB/PqqE/SkfB family radical SAM enzyme
MSVSVGIGLTNDCNLQCPHCYRPADSIACLNLADVQRICARLTATSFNLGTGESALHPEFEAIVEFLAGQGLKLSMASNGYSLMSMPEPLLRAFHDVEVSIDFAEADAQDRFRGAGNWRTVFAAIERCRSTRVEVTILATLMSINVDQMDGLARLAASLGVGLRVNVYQPVHAGPFTLTYEQFWDGFRRLFFGRAAGVH